MPAMTLRELKDSYDWQQAFEVAAVRSATPWVHVVLDKPNVNQVVKIIALSDGEHDGPHWVGIFKLRDCRYVAVSSGCDYTGWDCQSGGDVMVANNRADIMRFGLGDEERTRLGVVISESRMARRTPVATRDELPPFRLVDRGNGPGED